MMLYDWLEAHRIKQARTIAKLRLPVIMSRPIMKKLAWNRCPVINEQPKKQFQLG